MKSKTKKIVMGISLGLISASIIALLFGSGNPNVEIPAYISSLLGMGGSASVGISSAIKHKEALKNSQKDHDVTKNFGPVQETPVKQSAQVSPVVSYKRPARHVEVVNDAGGPEMY